MGIRLGKRKGEQPTDEVLALPVVKAGRPSNDWLWPTRGHKVRPTGNRRPQAMMWNRKEQRWE